MKPSEIVLYRVPLGWRWLVELIWKLEHAFERAKAAGKAEDDTRVRILFILAVFGLGYLGLAVGASYTALINDPGKRGVLNAADGARADLVDRNGNLLAVDLIHYGLYLRPKQIWNKDETRRSLTAVLPQLQSARLEKALHQDRRVYLLGGLTPAERDAIYDLGLPGVEFENEQSRVYPLGPTASHLIGFSDRGGIGVAGAEREFDTQLRAQAGTNQPVALSIDLRVQAALQDELKKAAARFGTIGAAGIVTDAQTGEILALANAPDFDPNNFANAKPDDLINLASSRDYEMGSVFKVFTMAMGLDSGSATMNSTFDAEQALKIGDRQIHDFHATHQILTLPEVFIHSSNIGTAKLALQAGGDNLRKYFKVFGLFDPAMADAAKPIVPKRWPDDTIASTSFGAAIAVTPMNVAAGAGAIMNGGRFVPLTLHKLDPKDYPQGARVVSETTTRHMLDLMRLNVTSPEGSGGQADAPGFSVGGKTGSAEKPIGGHYVRDKLVSSFVAVFPTDGPINTKRYIVFIMLDQPKGLPSTYGFATGGWNAAPTAGRVIDRIAPFVGVHRSAVPAGAKSKIGGAYAPPPGATDDTTGGDL